MNQQQWTAVDDYMARLFPLSDAVLSAALTDSLEAGLPAIQVAPNQGQMLAILARGMGARNILEIGTLGGYSAIWLGRALPPGGRMITLEASPLHADVARANLYRAGLADVVEVRLGGALDLLPELQPAAPFDFIFIDADKPPLADYLAWAVKLARPGSLIVTDNIIRKGAILDMGSEDPRVQGSRDALTLMAAEPRLTVSVIQTVGVKGYDGFALAIVNG